MFSSKLIPDEVISNDIFKIIEFFNEKGTLWKIAFGIVQTVQTQCQETKLGVSIK